jgi:acid phosphatase
MRMMSFRSIVVLVLALAGTACTTTQVAHDPAKDRGLLWVKHAAEYRALALQVYQAATLALPGFIEDRSWTVVPGNLDLRDLPPAVIMDVDETVVSNVDFQLNFEPPVTQLKIDTWNRENEATPVPGVAKFVRAARAAGVTVFFVTNRPCEQVPGRPGECPYRDTIVADLGELGIETDPEYVLLSNERGWTREKFSRRQQIAQTHRVIMLIGDDLSDFIACVRDKAYPPCSELGTPEGRRRLTDEYAHFWGNGWYVLPNPMHGSWVKTMQ